ncbi:hypothetical protein [Kitasatospora aureofaciens]
MCRFAIGLGRTPPVPARLAEVAEGRLGDLSGVAVGLVACGAVPTLR